MLIKWFLCARTLALASILFAGGCATPFGKAYNSCVKSEATAAFKQDTAPNIIAQVSSIVSLAVSAQWVQGMLTLAEDACFDTACSELFYCALTAWQQSHPNTPAASAKVQTAHLGVKAYLATKPASWHFECPKTHLALLEIPPVCERDPGSDVRTCRELSARGLPEYPETRAQ